ncbi:MAG: nickel-dependent lactate racemase [Chloroflexi bacterium]|nr:nickel-dependent lactate racemase [Chloroflexota bacterium]
MTATLTLPYGRGRVDLPLPPGPGLTPLAARAGGALPDPDAAVRQALRRPTGLPPLRVWVRPGERVAVVTSDATRPALQPTYLPHLLSELEAAGVPRDDTLLVIGLGTHRPPTPAEVRTLLGEAAGRYPVTWSNPDDRAALAGFGATPRGTPVRLFRPVAEAERVILTGSINHHVMAGFSAGPKSLLPGVAARDSILANHALTLNPDPPGGMNPDCRSGKLDGNPFYEDICDALAAFPVPTFLLNVVPAPEGGLLAAVAGEPLAAHREGCRVAGEHFAVPLHEPRPFVLASCGGYPRDINLYQSTKGLIHLGEALAGGGVGVLLAECSDGPGPEAFLEWLRQRTPGVIEARLRREFTVPGRVAHYVASLLARATVILVSGLDPAVVRDFGLHPAASLEAALTLARRHLPALSPGYLLPEASITLPLTNQ